MILVYLMIAMLAFVAGCGDDYMLLTWDTIPAPTPGILIQGCALDETEFQDLAERPPAGSAAALL